MTWCSESVIVPKVFISFVRTNRAKVERFAQALREHGVLVCLERDEITSRSDWQTALRNGIRQGAFFIACFSRQYRPRQKSHLNRELMEAIKELRQRPADQSWFIPVALNDCTIPDWSIGVGYSLLGLEWVDLSSDWEEGVQRIVGIIHQAAGRHLSTQDGAGNREAEAGWKDQESSSQEVAFQPTPE